MRILFALLVLLLGGAAVAAPVELHYFWAPGCPDCAVMRDYLGRLSAVFPELQIVAHEVGWEGEGFELMAAVAKAYGLERYATPVVVVGNVATTGIGLAVELRIAEEVARCSTERCPSPLARLSPPRGERPRSLVLLVGLGLLAALLVAWLLTR